MDNIQFWLYLGFGLIYFITRQMKKKKAAEQTVEEKDSPQEKQYKKPVSFEDLLKEFTQEQDEEEVVVEDEYVKPIPKKKVEEIIPNDDHTHRRFADDESRKVYQESIKQAEGADLKFERAANFKTKLERNIEEEEGSGLGNEIFESLKDADQAKKAVILGEILNRKY